jgi:hypothetical protein
MRRIGLLVALSFVLLAPCSARAAIGWLDEIKLGLLAHDVPIGGDRRESGLDTNAEVLFVSPGFLAPILAPRPHLGVSINSAGGNSYAYGGLTWTADLPLGLFAGLGLGGAVHSGPDTAASSTRDHKGLGTRLLFHESAEFGERITPLVDLSLFLDHISNANLGSHNPGITNLGLRAGLSF